MNRNDRSIVMMRTREFLTILQAECSSFSSFLDEVTSCEEEKLDNIPDGFSESLLSDKLTAGIENFNAANEIVQEIMSSAADIPDTLEIHIRKAREKGLYDKHSPCRKLSAPAGSERKTERLQLVLTPTLANTLKYESALNGTSVNEMINQILKREFMTNK